MYEYELIITMADGRDFTHGIGIKDDRMLDDEKKRYIDEMFRNEYIDFSDYFVFNEGNEYIVLNTRQISSIIIYERLIRT